MHHTHTHTHIHTHSTTFIQSGQWQSNPCFHTVSSVKYRAGSGFHPYLFFIHHSHNFSIIFDLETQHFSTCNGSLCFPWPCLQINTCNGFSQCGITISSRTGRLKRELSGALACLYICCAAQNIKLPHLKPLNCMLPQKPKQDLCFRKSVSIALVHISFYFLKTHKKIS